MWDVLMTKARKKIAMMLMVSLVMAMFFTPPAYASASDEAVDTADQAASNPDSITDLFWCALGYYDYCPAE